MSRAPTMCVPPRWDRSIVGAGAGRVESPSLATRGAAASGCDGVVACADGRRWAERVSIFDRVGRFIDDVLLLPDELRLELELGEAELEARSFRAAAARFEKVLALRPTLGRAWTDLAAAREGLGDVAAARHALRQGRAIEPDDPQLALWAARLAWRARDADEAAQAARDALRR